MEQKTLTTTEISQLVGIHRNNVISTLKRGGIAPIGKLGKADLFHIEHVSRKYPQLNTILNNAGIEAVNEENERSLRSDSGAVRGKNPALVELACRYALEFFLDGAIPDVLNACERAVRRIKEEYSACLLPFGATDQEMDKLTAEWLYKGRIKRRDSANSKNKQKFIGEYWSQGWEGLHLAKWRQHTRALSSAHVRYDLPKIMESCGIAGPGFGFGKLIMLDDRSADSWSENGEEMVLPTGVYVWDVLTGALLWVEPSRTISAQTYIRALVSVAHVWGFAENPMFFMENAKASTAQRVIGAVRSLYTPDELRTIESGNCELRKKMAHGCKTVVAYNLPHIPRHIGKASGERRFGIIKREYDAQYHALTFQGGNRDESVQLHINNQHWVLVANPNRPAFELPSAVVSKSDYFDKLMRWAYTEYIDRMRTSLRPWAKEHKCNPCVRDMISHYYSDNLRKPNEIQLAYLYYFAYPEKLHKVKVRAAGQVRCQIDYRTINITSTSITHVHIGRNIIIMPNQDNSAYLLFLADDVNNPKYLGEAFDATATTLDDIPRMRAEVRKQRDEANEAERMAIRSVQTPNKLLGTPHPLMPTIDSNGDVAELNEAQPIQADVIETEYTVIEEMPEANTDHLSIEVKQLLNLA